MPASQILEDLAKGGAVRAWDGPVGELEGGNFKQVDSTLTKWVGVGGISAVPKALSAQLDVRLDTWVASVERQGNGKWRLFLDSQKRRPLSASPTRGVQEDFNYICVAHNGKCAERLMRDADVPSLHRLLKCRFGAGPPPKALMQLSSLWVCWFAVKGSGLNQPRTLASACVWRENVALGAGSLGLPFEGAFVKGSDALCWAADNTRKLRDTSAGAADDDVEAWTLISTRPFGAANKVPLENVPQEVAERVTAELLRAFETAAGLPTRYPSPPTPRGSSAPSLTYRFLRCMQPTCAPRACSLARLAVAVWSSHASRH